MKLRNKKTGEIKDIRTILHEAFTVHGVEVLMNLEANWEDYKPTEPLIKDEEVPAPARDAKTKAAFEAYLTLHPEQRFFQAVRNFTNLYLDGKVDRICCHRSRDDDGWFEDTFYWECDKMLEKKNEN